MEDMDYGSGRYLIKKELILNEGNVYLVNAPLLSGFNNRTPPDKVPLDAKAMIISSFPTQ